MSRRGWKRSAPRRHLRLPAVRDHVHGRLDLAFEPSASHPQEHRAAGGSVCLGSTRMPIRHPGCAPVSPGQPRSPHAVARTLVIALWPLLVVAGVAGAGGGDGRHYLPRVPEVLRTTLAAVQAPAPVAQGGRPRTQGFPAPLSVVLPFDNFGGGGVDSVAIDGVTEDLTTLSRMPDFVVAREFGVRITRASRSTPGASGRNSGCVTRGRQREQVDGALRVSVQLSRPKQARTVVRAVEAGADGANDGIDDSCEDRKRLARRSLTLKRHARSRAAEQSRT